MNKTSQNKQRDASVAKKHDHSNGGAQTVASQEIHQLIAEQFQGPIPPPQIVAGYEAILSGSTDRLFSMAESEAKHRHEMDMKILNGELKGQQYEARDTLVGQIFTLIIGLSTVGGSVYTTISGYPFAGSFLGVAGLTGLVSVFIAGRNNSKNKDQNDKFPVSTEPQTQSINK